MKDKYPILLEEVQDSYTQQINRENKILCINFNLASEHFITEELTPQNVYLQTHTKHLYYTLRSCGEL